MKRDDLSMTVLLSRVQLLEQQRDYWMGVAETDTLTKMPNRRSLERQTSSRGGWFIFCDLKGFKKAQDSHPDGHQYGDRVLREFADFLLTNSRLDVDTVSARLGGDEFVVWSESYQGAERIMALIMAWKSADGRVSACAGMGNDIESADAAMYKSKK